MSDLNIEEQKTVIKTQQVLDNAIVLSNIVELTTSVIIKIAGKDIADVIDNQGITRTMLNNIVANRIKDKVLKEGV